MAQPVSSTLPLKASLDPQTYSTQVPIMPQKGPSSGYPYPERSQSDHEHAFKLSQTSKHKSKVVKRAKSTPHLNVSASTSPTAESPEDSTERKRINKLGYHRTTIACGHCRKRKIRCQPQLVPDQSGKCSNCVRLKKECMYFPIDPTAAPEPRARHQDSIDSAITTTSVRSTSPNSHPYGQMTGTSVGLSPELAYHQDRFNGTSPRDGYHMLHHSASWESQNYRSFPPISEDAPQEYTTQERWQMAEIPTTSGMENYILPPSVHSQAVTAPGHHVAGVRNEAEGLGVPQQRIFSFTSTDPAQQISYSPHSSHRSSVMQDTTRSSSTFSYPSSFGIENIAIPSGSEALSAGMMPLMPVQGNPDFFSPQYAFHDQYNLYSDVQHQHQHQTVPAIIQPPDGHGYDAIWYGNTNHRS